MGGILKASAGVGSGFPSANRAIRLQEVNSPIPKYSRSNPLKIRITPLD